ncbi:MAG: diguanylate cyclase [Gammaproteobacteria bacterium]|nr:diguanylate cyclase [Gammaproteobacteria bacterium]
MLTANHILIKVAAALLYWGLAHVGMSIFALQPDNITLLWLPSGVALVMCLQWGYRAVPWIVLASFIANFPGMASDSMTRQLLHTAINAMADGLAGIIAMLLFRRLLPEGLATARDLLPFAVGVCLVTTLISSIIITLNLAFPQYIAWEQVGSYIRMLTLGDSLGILLVYPIYQGWQEFHRLSLLNLQWLMTSALLCSAIMLLAFTWMPGAIFFILPLLLVFSFRLSLLGVALLNAFAMVGTVVGTARGLGPFIAADQLDSQFRLLAFVFSGAFTILGMAVQYRQLSPSQQSNVSLKEAADLDPLTGLMNRRSFMPLLQHEHQRALRRGANYTFAMLDLDHFKDINDRCGQEAGDEMLRLFADIMQANCRHVEYSVRMGGEEFGILFPDCTGAQALLPLERIHSTLEKTPLPFRNQSIAMTVSIGLTSFTAEDTKLLDVLARADKAMYAAKEAGRNCIVQL